MRREETLPRRDDMSVESSVAGTAISILEVSVEKGKEDQSRAEGWVNSPQTEDVKAREPEYNDGVKRAANGKTARASPDTWREHPWMERRLIVCEGYCAGVSRAEARAAPVFVRGAALESKSTFINALHVHKRHSEIAGTAVEKGIVVGDIPSKSS